MQGGAIALKKRKLGCFSRQGQARCHGKADSPSNWSLIELTDLRVHCCLTLSQSLDLSNLKESFY